MAWGAIGGSMGGASLQQLTSDIIGHFKSKKDARKSEQLYRKRYQTMVNDLKAAGLNPMLAYGGMGGAMPVFPEVHGGASPPAETPSQRAERGAGSARQLAEASNLRALGDNIRKTGSLIDAQIDETWSRSGQNAAATGRLDSERRLTDLQRQVQEAIAPYTIRREAAGIVGPELEAGFLRDLGEAYPWAKRILGILGAGAAMRRGSSRQPPTPPAEVPRYVKPRSPHAPKPIRYFKP